MEANLAPRTKAKTPPSKRPAPRTCLDRPAAGGPYRTSRWKEEASWDSVLCPDVLPYRRMPAGVPERCETIEAHYGPVAQRIEQQPSKLKVAGSIPAGVASSHRRNFL
jgi:hypothetical protein